MFWSKQYFWYWLSQPYHFNRQPYFTSYRTTQWDTGKAEHLTDQIYSRGTHMKALIQPEALQEQTAPADGCGHQGSQQTHHKASQKPSLCNPKLPGKHLWLTRASSTAKIPSCTGWTCNLHHFPPFQRASSVCASQLRWGNHTGLHTELLKENTAFMPHCFYAKWNFKN